MSSTPDLVDLTIGITASVACYKALLLCRQAQLKGWSCRFLMTSAATQLISPTLCQAISGRPVYIDGQADDVQHAMPHIALARATRRLCLYPATQHSIAKLSLGLSDNLLLQTCLARETHIPLFVAPAMNTAMWQQHTTQEHLQRLRQQGVIIMDPRVGEQACGDVGIGPLMEPDDALGNIMYPPIHPLSFHSVLVTAGPTRSMIDPVRCLQNLSSGKMGFEIARTLARYHIPVTLIHGPCALPPPDHVATQAVSSTEEMYEAVMHVAHRHAVFIANAAPTDYRPTAISTKKIRKNEHSALQLSFEKTPDILNTVGHLTSGRPFCVGFCLDLHHDHEVLSHKYQSKQLDMIFGCALNSSVGQNNITLTLYDGKHAEKWPSYTKEEAAYYLVRAIHKRYTPTPT